MRADWWYALLCKLPTYDPTWSPEIQSRWFEAVRDLRRLAQEAEEA